MPSLRSYFGVGDRFKVKKYDGYDSLNYIPPSDFRVKKKSK